MITPKQIIRFIARKVLGITPLAGTYEREVSFFSKITLEELERLDEDSLGAEMRMIAHGFDKELYFPGHKQLFKHFKPRLKQILHLWEKAYPMDESTYQWAKEVLRKYEDKWGSD